jgi:Tfp pilus assembly protein PilE
VQACRPTDVRDPRWSDERGFTLSELLLVSVFVVGLVLVALSSARGIEAQNRHSNCQTELRNLKMAVAEFHAERTTYPASVAEVVSAGKADLDSVDSWTIDAGGGDVQPTYRPVLGRC